MPRGWRAATEPSGVSTRAVCPDLRRKPFQCGERCRAARSTFGVNRGAHGAADHVVRIAKRHALAHEIVGEVGGGGGPPRSAARIASGTGSSPPMSLASSVSSPSACRPRRTAAPCLPGYPCCRRAAEPFISASSAISAPKTRPLLPRTSSGTSGFFFCGMIDEPVQYASGRPTSRSAFCPPAALRASATGAPWRARARAELDREIAVRHRIERVLAERFEAQRARDAVAVDRSSCRRAPRCRAAAVHLDAPGPKCCSRRVPAWRHRPSGGGQTSPAGPPAG